jgi:hypothetical protein
MVRLARRLKMPRFRPKLFGIVDDGTPTAQEHRVADHVKGKRQRGSGASVYAKGDVKHESFLIECKKTIHASLSVKGAWLDKITKEAQASGKEPALAIEIQGMDSNFAERDWVAVPMSVFKRLLEQSDM